MFRLLPSLLLLVPAAAAARDYTSVLWDETHGVVSTYSSTGKFSKIVAQLGTEGYVVTVTTAGVDTLSLGSVGVIVIPVTSAYSSAYTASEATAIEAFVEDGGGVVIVGDSLSAWPTNLALIPAIWGVSTGTTYGVDTSITSFSTHAVTTGLAQLTVSASGDLTFSTEGEAVADTSTGTFLWVNEAGNGRVVILGDVNVWDNTRLSAYDNSVFATNVFAWVSYAQGADYDVDGDGYGPGDDCDDTDSKINPGEPELCDGVDNDCDGTVDNADAADALPWYADTDADSYGDPASAVTACSPPAGYVADIGDCDDSDPVAHVGATEVCDGEDNDCDGTADNDDAVDAPLWYADTDSDGHGNLASTTTACTQPTGYVENTSDCDDTTALAYTGAAEYCDGIDNDCDGLVDNDDALDAATWFADTDADGYGDAANSTTACAVPAGYVENTDDCNDAEPLAYAGAVERCDGVDNDCDGTVDNDDAVDAPWWYADEDTDGYGTPLFAMQACDAPADHVSNADDCDDSTALAWTGAPELCDGVDNDCDGTVDNSDADDARTWYADGDTDAHGDPASFVTACEAPPGYVGNDDDCDDAEARSWPGNPEVCDGVDNDCDGLIDPETSADVTAWFDDVDHDNYGDPNVSTAACDQPKGFVADNTDCNDLDDAIHPGADDPPNDGVDQDCDGEGGEPVDTGDTADSGDTGDSGDSADPADSDTGRPNDGLNDTGANDTGAEPRPDCGCAAGNGGAGAAALGVVASLVARRRRRAPRGHQHPDHGHDPRP